MSETTIFGSSSFQEAGNSEKLEYSLAAFYQWGFLGLGAFSDIQIPTSGVFGGNAHRLRPVKDPQDISPATHSRYWEGFRRDWVWESGVEHTRQPIEISGVFVDGVFRPATGIGPHSFYVNYPLGKVVFQSGIPTTGVVTAEFSCRDIQVVTADVSWFRQLQENAFRVDDSQFLQAGSGAWDILAQNRVQLPALVVEVIPSVRSQKQAYELGSLRHWQKQDVTVWVLATDRRERARLHDFVSNQWSRRIHGVDLNLLSRHDRWPLTPSGTRSSGILMYPDLVKATGDGGYRWGTLEFCDARGSPIDNYPLYGAQVNLTVEYLAP